MADLSHRVVEAEVMDDPSLAPAEHIRALQGLSRINRVSGCGRALWRAIVNCPGLDDRSPLRVLDIATGSGDVPLALWHRAQREHREVRLCGVDISTTAIDAARRRATEAEAPIEFRPLDVLCEPIPDGFDIITCGLFLHHLSDEQAVDLLGAMRQAAGRGVIVSDLRRCRAGLLAAQIGCRILSRSPVVRIDGPRSVRAAFSVEEARRLADAAGMGGSMIQRRFPWRWLLVWLRTQSTTP